MRLSRTNDSQHKRLNILIFGEPKVGKTSLAKTLPVSDDSKVYYLAVDPGQLALRSRKFVIGEPDEGQQAGEKFFEEAYQHLLHEGHKYEWVIVDGCDEIAESILKDRLKTQRDARKGYGEMAEYVEDWMKRMRDISGVSTIFITHIECKDVGENQVVYEPMFPGKQIQKQVNAWFDLIGCMRIVKGPDGNNQRVLQFSPDMDTRYKVGDRSGVLSGYENPNLSEVFDKIHKAGLETRGEWSPPLPQVSASDFPDPVVTEVELRNLVEVGKMLDKTPDQLMALSQKMYGKGPRELLVSEYGKLIEQLRVMS